VLDSYQAIAKAKGITLEEAVLALQDSYARVFSRG
jgi:hypothetical protein